MYKQMFEKLVCAQLTRLWLVSILGEEWVVNDLIDMRQKAERGVGIGLGGG